MLPRVCIRRASFMPIAESDVRWVTEPKMNLLERLYFPAIVAGLQTTVTHIFKPKVTVQFPEQRLKMPPNYRSVHRLDCEEEGRDKCVACYICSTSCRAHCIYIVAAPSPWPDGDQYGELLVIHELDCIYCGI